MGLTTAREKFKLCQNVFNSANALEIIQNIHIQKTMQLRHIIWQRNDFTTYEPRYGILTLLIDFASISYAAFFFLKILSGVKQFGFRSSSTH